MDCLRGRPPPGQPYHPAYARNYIAAFAIPWVWLMSPDVRTRGAHLVIAETLRIPPSSVDPTAKNFHWADLTRGQFEAHDRGADFCLLLDADGHVTEGAGYNVFVVIDGKVVTPDARRARGHDPALRDRIVRRSRDPAARSAGSRPRKRATPTRSSSRRRPAASCPPRIDGRIMSNDRPGPISTRLHDMFWAKRAEGWHATPVDYGKKI